jgi:hypothetical protein
MNRLQNQFEAPSEISSGLSAQPDSLLQRTCLYREFLAEREEILRHKWLESEKAGRDIGFESALTTWVIRHRALWRRARREQNAGGQTGDF